MKDRGILYALGAYIAWGLFPIYWKWLSQVPAVQLLGHRIMWSFILLAVFLLLTRRWADFREKLSVKVLRIYLVAAMLIGVNWLTYVWAINAGFIIETSLGYFINPLLSVLLGVIFFRERLRPTQWIPIGLVAAGVLYLTVSYGSLPWIALTLAISWGFYGLVKKMAPLGSVYGVTLETGILFLPALGYLVMMDVSGSGKFLHDGILTDLLLAGAGVVTTIPLLMFAKASRRIPLSMIGILQYISQTLTFIIGLSIYHEPVTQSRLIGFGIVWLALIIFWVENRIARHNIPPVVPEFGED
ncbi:MAG: EamA family transporter RarD [Anaerolineaceae bacterium]|nr:EamA family transporter RarD [Anaerolineaceae bacterium]